MHRNFTSILLACSLLLFLVLLPGCSDTENTATSASQAAAQLGLGGDDISLPSKSLEVMTEGAQAGVWTSDYPAAQELAKSQDLPILLFFNGADWSMSSNLFIQNVLDNQEWRDYQSGLVLVYLDCPRHNPNFPASLKEQNDALRNQFRINDFPSMLLITATGELVGNLRVNSQTNTHDLVRNIKLFRRRIPSEIDKLVAQTQNPVLQEAYNSFKETSDARLKFFEETQAKIKEMDETLLRLGTQVEELIADWEISRQTPEDQEAYRKALQARKTAEAELEAFMTTSPGNTPENQRRFQQLQEEIQRQQRVIDEITVK